MSSASPLLIIISAPSGGGKTTLVKQLLATQPSITRVVTCTTRPPRPGEVEGVDYYFMSPDDFRRRVQVGEFLEHAAVYGNSYGTLKSEVIGKLRSGKDVLLNMDVQGVATVCIEAAKVPEIQQAMMTVFLTPASIAILEQRLVKRGEDLPEVIQRRLAVARAEVGRWNAFDYLLISTSIQEDLRRMLAIIEAERMRTSRTKPPEF